jgi:chromosome segregation ATPase
MSNDPTKAPMTAEEYITKIVMDKSDRTDRTITVNQALEYGNMRAAEQAQLDFAASRGAIEAIIAAKDAEIASREKEYQDMYDRHAAQCYTVVQLQDKSEAQEKEIASLRQALIETKKAYAKCGSSLIDAKEEIDSLRSIVDKAQAVIDQTQKDITDARWKIAGHDAEMVAFLDSVRDYMRESRNNIGFDERTSEEFLAVFRGEGSNQQIVTYTKTTP